MSNISDTVLFKGVSILRSYYELAETIVYIEASVEDSRWDDAEEWVSKAKRMVQRLAVDGAIDSSMRDRANRILGKVGDGVRRQNKIMVDTEISNIQGLYDKDLTLQVVKCMKVPRLASAKRRVSE